MNHFHKFCAFFLLLIISGCQSERPATKQTSQESEVKSETYSSGRYRFRIDYVICKNDPGRGHFWGWRKAEASEITCLWVAYNGEPFVMTKRSLFTDLSDFRQVTLSSNGAKAMLKIKGSDDGQGYDATIRFVDGRAVSRLVQDRVFPGHFFEQTKYVSIPVEEN